MPMNGPLNTPYDSPLVGTPGVGEANTKGEDVSLNLDGAVGLTGTPFEKPLTTAPSQDATGNTSGIPDFWNTVGGIPDAPAPGTQVVVIGEVKSPNIPVADIAGGKDLSKNIGIGKS